MVQLAALLNTTLMEMEKNLPLSRKQLGVLQASPGIMALCEQDPLFTKTCGKCFFAHVFGDWGSAGKRAETSVTAEEYAGDMFATDDPGKLNLIHLQKNDGTVHSMYPDTKIWIITELNISTVLMLPSEY